MRHINQTRTVTKSLPLMLLLVMLCYSNASTALENKADAIAALKEHGINEIIYAARGIHTDGHWYANMGYHVAVPRIITYNNRTKSKLVRYNLQTGKETILLEDNTSGIRDPQVHYDAEKILFSYRKGGEAQYHLYEINIDGSNLRQLTGGIYDDLEPSYLPDGGDDTLRNSTGYF